MNIGFENQRINIINIFTSHFIRMVAEALFVRISKCHHSPRASTSQYSLCCEESQSHKTHNIPVKL